MALEPKHQYNANCFAIAPERESIILLQEPDETILAAKNYKIFNIGKTTVYVGLLYGVQTEGYIVVYPVEPGETKILLNKKNWLQTIRLKVINKTNLRAIVHVCTADGHGICSIVVPRHQELYNYEYNKQLRELFSIGVKYIPYLNKKFRALLDAYWPSNKLNIWEEIELKLQPLLESHVLDRVRGFFNSYIQNIGQRLTKLTVNFENGRLVSNDYIKIAMDLTGFEERLVYKGKFHYYKAMNKFLLPLYSNFILMKITFYTLGIICSKDLSLTAGNVNYLKDQINFTINGNSGATKRIADMHNEWVSLIYDTCDPEDIYNSMMNTRSLITLHGIEHSRIWDNMIRNPFTMDENNVISYSTFFGRPTANLYKEAIADTMAPPLTPRLIGNKRNCIRSVDIFFWRKFPSASPKIGGARITFENDDIYVMGTVSEDVKNIAFDKAHIVKLMVTGDGKVDSCVFYMSDNRKLEFGTRDSETSEEIFELKDHHIVSFFLSSDNVTLGGQVANIAVAFCLNKNYE